MSVTKVGHGVSVPLVRPVLAPFDKKSGIVIEELQLPPPPPGYVPKSESTQSVQRKPVKRPTSAEDRARAKPFRVRAPPTEAELEEARTAKRWPGLFQNLVGPKTAPFIAVSPTAQQRAQSPNPGRTISSSDSQSSLLSLKSVSSPYVQRPKAVPYSGHIEPPLPDSSADRAKGVRPSEKRDLPGLSTLKSQIKSKPFQSASKNNTVYGGSLRRPYTGPSLYVKAALAEGAVIDFSVSSKPTPKPRPASALPIPSPPNQSGETSLNPLARLPNRLSTSESTPQLHYTSSTPANQRSPKKTAHLSRSPSPPIAPKFAAALALSPLHCREILPDVNPMKQPPLDPGGPLELPLPMTHQRAAAEARAAKYREIDLTRSPRETVPNTMRRPTSPYSDRPESPFVFSAAASAAAMQTLLSQLNLHETRVRSPSPKPQSPLKSTRKSVTSPVKSPFAKIHLTAAQRKQALNYLPEDVLNAVIMETMREELQLAKAAAEQLVAQRSQAQQGNANKTKNKSGEEECVIL